MFFRNLFYPERKFRPGAITHKPSLFIIVGLYIPYFQRLIFMNTEELIRSGIKAKQAALSICEDI